MLKEVRPLETFIWSQQGALIFPSRTVFNLLNSSSWSLTVDDRFGLYSIMSFFPILPAVANRSLGVYDASG